MSKLEGTNLPDFLSCKSPLNNMEDEITQLRAQVEQLTEELKYLRMAATAEARRVDELYGENRQQAEALRIAKASIKQLLSAERMSCRPPETVQQAERKLDAIRWAVTDAEVALSAIDTLGVDAKPQSQWLPLETAPKDGSKVLLQVSFIERNNVVIGWFGVDPNNGEETQEWLFGDGDAFSCGYYYTPCKPISWMPLPAPDTKGV